LNTELFIARKIFTGKGNNKGVSNRFVTIAVGSISLGLAVMIISVSVLVGFKKEIREKVIGFGSHFQLVNYDSNYSFETIPVEIDSVIIKKSTSVPHVKHIQLFATKPGLIKTDTDIHGMVLKGVGANYNWDFFSKNLIDGKVPVTNTNKRTDDVIVSEKMARLLKLETGSPLYCFFYNEGENTPRSRKFSISGIYRTSLEEFDEIFIVGDIRHVQRLNGWSRNEVSGYEIQIDDFSRLNDVYPFLREITLNEANENTMLRAYSIEAKYPMLFDWLSVLNMNVWVLLVLMVAVAGINMISGVLIIIIERTRMIGILKALGYPNLSVRKVFIYLSSFLSLRGLMCGNILVIGLCLLQHFTGVLKLDPVSYYIDVVPVTFNIFYVFLLNAGTLIAITAFIIIPSFFISKISPVEAIAVE
jgi:lipoprotein-releasing system permease protein